MKPQSIVKEFQKKYIKDGKYDGYLGGWGFTLLSYSDLIALREFLEKKGDVTLGVSDIYGDKKNGLMVSMLGRVTSEIDMKESQEKKAQENDKILSKIGLSEDDFVRFRGVWLSGTSNYDEEKKGRKFIWVKTRENGVNGFSSDAIKKAGDAFLERYNDDFDSTYAYYVFKNPSSAK